MKDEAEHGPFLAWHPTDCVDQDSAQLLDLMPFFRLRLDSGSGELATEVASVAVGNECVDGLKCRAARIAHPFVKLAQTDSNLFGYLFGRSTRLQPVFDVPRRLPDRPGPVALPPWSDILLPHAIEDGATNLELGIRTQFYSLSGVEAVDGGYEPQCSIGDHVFKAHRIRYHLADSAGYQTYLRKMLKNDLLPLGRRECVLGGPCRGGGGYAGIA